VLAMAATCFATTKSVEGSGICSSVLRKKSPVKIA